MDKNVYSLECTRKNDIVVLFGHHLRGELGSTYDKGVVTCCPKRSLSMTIYGSSTTHKDMDPPPPRTTLNLAYYTKVDARTL